MCIALALWRIDPIYRLRTLKTPPQVAGLAPIKEKEVKRFVHVISNLCGLTNKETSILLIISERILNIWKNSGVKFSIQYLSESLRLICNFIAGEGVADHSHWVSQFSNGIPKIVGIKGRDILVDLLKDSENGSPSRLSMMGRAIITLISIFRVQCPEHVLKFNTVTDPWKGTGTLSDSEIMRGLTAMNLGKFRLKSPKFIWSNKSGVNARFAFLSVGLDLIALIGKPRIWIGIIKYCIQVRYILFPIIFILLSISFIPLVIFNYLFVFLGEGISLNLGRLAIIKELRGKARVVGITDAWTQMLFKPLHDEIYAKLGKIPEDGTRDQLAPVKLLLSNLKNPYAVSVDLSAATDRLPVELQARILNCLGLPGDTWREILARPYEYMDREYVYAVGQPMGAYSSFAMLALTNHLIMYAAANKLGLVVVKGSGLYAILGDDVAISRGDLATEYNKIMHLLGVEINPIKGFTGKILEFAKNLFHVSGTNLSPISAKVILRAARDPIYIVPLINDYINKGYWIILNTTLSNITKLLESTHSMSVAQSTKWLFSILGPQSGFWSYSESNAGYAAWQVLFEEFLRLRVGISLTDVTRWYYKVLWNKASYPLSSVIELGEGYLRIGRFSQKPWIWSPKKFEQSCKLPSPEYMAGLTSASSMAILLPVLLYYYISALLFGILLAGVSKITGSKGLDKELLNSFKNPLESIVGELVVRILNLDFTGRARAFQVMNTPHEGVFTNIGWFQGWVSTMRLPRPMQLLNTRFKREMKSLDDDMPAVLTAERCLSANSKLLAKYYNSVRKVRRLEEKIRKLKKQGKAN
ncbi:RNA-dependent RNA polymerase [Rhizoctonia cerealis mitovirus]|uniref:RNA-dependent RNA polymerase n=1 Tax=Rhizoctonia cerealis mitovirus TaxID=1561961 RepID=A0ABM5RNX7_9VIRU|nr:RNA-dependent RNA polymerase [Rhizoctonia cerealis mitovirus]AIT71973.1 RNA-dependent RNA polymerase [Rhizoctonia cerealis mitovirus]